MTEEEISVQEKYEEVLATGNENDIGEFLNQQNISDVAELVEENEDSELEIFLHLSLHRAVSLFKILVGFLAKLVRFLDIENSFFDEFVDQGVGGLGHCRAAEGAGGRQTGDYFWNAIVFCFHRFGEFAE